MRRAARWRRRGYGREARQRQQTEGRSVDYVQPGIVDGADRAPGAGLVNLSRPGEVTRCGCVADRSWYACGGAVERGYIECRFREGISID